MSAQYTGRCAVQQGMFSTLGGYHDSVGKVIGKTIEFVDGNPSVLNIPQCTHDIPTLIMLSPQCTHGIHPVYWTSPTVLNVFPHTHHGIPPHSSWYSPTLIMVPPPPPLYWTPPSVLMNPPVFWTPPGVLNDIPPVYWTSPVYFTPPGVLHRHYAGL